MEIVYGRVRSQALELTVHVKRWDCFHPALMPRLDSQLQQSLHTYPVSGSVHELTYRFRIASCSTCNLASHGGMRELKGKP